MECPDDWPIQADDDYTRIRILGEGAFGQVWLAKSKEQDENGVHALVAIKGVSIANENDGATAEREIAILAEMDHPNIIRLLHDYEPASAAAKGRYMTLSYINGSDLGVLLEERGALGLPLAQLVARDLISAVSYMHVRGVMHRDIKPDNIMLEGCKEGKEQWIYDDVMWENKKIKPGRFKAVLIDLGFARATSADDYQSQDGNKRQMMNKHKSRYIFKAKSAVGTKHFAPPEITGSIRHRDASEIGLTSCVSSYGLIVDAYAVGATISEITTGVPPGNDVDTYVKNNRVPKKYHPMEKIRKKLKINKKSSEHPGIQLRCMKELPKPLADLIQQMMKEDINERMSCREAQEHAWMGGKVLHLFLCVLVQSILCCLLFPYQVLMLTFKFSTFRVRSSSTR